MWFCYGGLLLGMVAGNYPLYRYVYSLPDYYRYLFGYNCLACMLIAVLLVIRMKGEKKEERRLQEMVRERERQYEEWNSMIIGEGLSQKLPADNVFDTMLQSKCQICERYQISLKCEWKIPREMNVEDADKTGLIGNLMDNAIEACIRQTEGEKVIRLNTYRQANFWIIRVDNSKHDKPLKPGLKTEKKEKQDHGMGMEIIENIVEKYDGAMKIHEDGKWFSIIVMLRIK
ncbi:MAG: ATP-binding protein [Clostridia bacterium]|nr:ATP-binding protein [Clostridia bacterium]